MTLEMRPVMTIGRLVALSALMFNAGTHGEPISTGVEQVLIPLGIIVTPFLKLEELISGSDSKADDLAAKAATRILDNDTQSIPATGLYAAGPIDLTWALGELLVGARLPLVEIDAKSAAWLFSFARTSRLPAFEALESKFIRLQLGRQGDPDCLIWKSRANDPTAHPPVRPGTCITASYDNSLRSNVALGVGTSRAAKRELQWELIDMGRGTSVLSIPFWSQSTGKPLQLRPFISIRSGRIFMQLIGKLAPQSLPRDPHDRPYLLGEISPVPFRSVHVPRVEVAGELRALALDWPKGSFASPSKPWSDLYEEAFATGKPAIGGGLLVMPKDDKVGPSCADPTNCTSERHHLADSTFLTEVGVLTAGRVRAYGQHSSSKEGAMPALPPRNMRITVSGRKFDGEVFWHLSVVPSTLPEPLQPCSDFSFGCGFLALAATVTLNELVIRGRISSGNYSFSPREEYELVVPLDSLPPVPRLVSR